MSDTATRGTTNGNDRGSAASRRVRRAWLMATYASDVPGFCRCYRCGCLLFNPDDYLPAVDWVALGTGWEITDRAAPLTIDRIIPGCQGGTYRRNNIRPACGRCNFSTGGRTRRKGK